MQKMNSFSEVTPIEKVKAFFKESLGTTGDEVDDYDTLWSGELEDGRRVTYRVDPLGTVVKQIEVYDDEFDNEVLVWSNHNELVNKIFTSEFFDDKTLVMRNGCVNYEKVMQLNLRDTCITDDLKDFIKTRYEGRRRACNGCGRPEPGIYKSKRHLIKVLDACTDARTYTVASRLETDAEVFCLPLDEFYQNYEKIDLKESVVECIEGLLSEFFGSKEPIPIKQVDDSFAYASTELSIVFDGVGCYFVPYEVDGEDDYGCIFDLPIAIEYCEVTEDHFDWLEGYCEELFEIASIATEECDEILILKEQFKKKLKDLRKCLEKTLS